MFLAENRFAQCAWTLFLRTKYCSVAEIGVVSERISSDDSSGGEIRSIGQFDSPQQPTACAVLQRAVADGNPIARLHALRRPAVARQTCRVCRFQYPLDGQAILVGDFDIEPDMRIGPYIFLHHSFGHDERGAIIHGVRVMRGRRDAIRSEEKHCQT